MEMTEIQMVQKEVDTDNLSVLVDEQKVNADLLSMATPVNSVIEHSSYLSTAASLWTTVFSLSPQPILIADHEFVILKGNSAFADICGITVENTLPTPEGEGACEALEQKRRTIGMVTIAFPAGVQIQEKKGINREIGDLISQFKLE